MKRGGGGEKSFSHAEGGTQKVWGSFYVVVLAILKGGGEGHNKFRLFKRGAQKVLSCTLS